MAVGVKHIWTKEQIKYLQDNWPVMTNRQLSDGLGITLTLVRTKLYKMGMLRMEMEYWTPAQVKFLVKNYKKYGDTELTELFTKKWKKKKGWTKKHIEKKRSYLKLKRTEYDKELIFERNINAGRFRVCNIKRWLKTGVFPDGTVRLWRTWNGRIVPFIKVNGRFIHWARHKWQIAVGPVPKDMNVVFKTAEIHKKVLGDPEILKGITDVREWLELVTNGELAKKNSEISSRGLSDNYVAGIMTFNDKEAREILKRSPHIINLKRQQLKLNRKIYEQENNAA